MYARFYGRKERTILVKKVFLI